MIHFWVLSKTIKVERGSGQWSVPHCLFGLGCIIFNKYGTATQLWNKQISKLICVVVVMSTVSAHIKIHWCYIVNISDVPSCTYRTSLQAECCCNLWVTYWLQGPGVEVSCLPTKQPLTRPEQSPHSVPLWD